MNMMKRLLLVLMALMLCVAMTACQKTEETPETPETPEVTEVPAVTTSADDVLITVGTETVTRGEYEENLNTLNTYYSQYGYDVTDASIAAMLKQFALQTGVEYAVMDLKVVENGLALTDADKVAAEAEAREQWAATIEDGMVYYGVTEESTEEERTSIKLSVLAELESMGYTEESYIADAILYAGYDKLYDLVTRDVAVSDEDVVNYFNSLVENDKAIYENDAAAYEQALYMNQLYAAYGMDDYVTEIYYKPAGYRLVTHILLAADEELLTAYADLQAAYEEQQSALEEGEEVTDTLVTAEEVENARLAILANVQPTVDEINQKLAEGATFAELIPQYTTDPGMQDEASIATGYEVHMDSINWVIPFRDQAFTVDTVGQVTAPVVTDYGVHILQYVADVPAGATELTEEMKAAFKAELLASAQDEAYTAAVTQWMEEIVPVYSEEAQAILAEAAAIQAQYAE